MSKVLLLAITALVCWGQKRAAPDSGDESNRSFLKTNIVVTATRAGCCGPRQAEPDVGGGDARADLAWYHP
jgi:hypothetical protein